ncbi:hypothetical protein KO495_13965 [Colwellia sp. D2M02]|uniref:Uncharacterized protein n=1 Tax=Colwellia asteriadis TaxID=517723 RepID=A0ABN1L9Q3_9GAMM|nr:hypothetical protein [Colwellia sp. D2M02]MBU2894413.1 hypothetical protein [Colwellia sp. D2M02]
MHKHSSAPINFIDMKDLSSAPGDLQVFANDYQQTLPSNEWRKYWGGIFIIKNITPATYH